MARTRVLIVDDHAILRQGIRQTLELEEDLEVVGEAGDGVEAVRRCAELKPDLVLMDISMPVMNGILASRLIKQQFPDTRILVLTIHQDEGYLLQAAQAGVEGYVLKDIDPRDLVGAIRTTARGQAYLDPNVGGRLMKGYGAPGAGPAGRGGAAGGGAARGGPPATGGGVAGGPLGAGLGGLDARGVAPGVDLASGLGGPNVGGDQGPGGLARPGPGAGTPPDALTRREQEVLTLLTEGSSNRQIAERLFISEKTAKHHISHILEKLGVQDRTQAAVLAVKKGWVREG